MLRLHFLATIVALAALCAVINWPPGASGAQAAPSGPNALVFRCGGQWAPIQAKVSGFVVGGCRGGTPVLGVATDECLPGCIRGSQTEGRGWEAASLPSSAHFAGCGWINLQNRLDDGRSMAPPPDRCGRVSGPDVVLPEQFVKRYTGRRIGGAPRPSTAKYRGLYLWAGHFTSGANKGTEGGAIRYRPRFADPRKTCTAYANLNPWMPGQKVRPSERMWVVHDRSPHLQIRYLARFRARNERGQLRWWVNAHSTDPADRRQPWGFVAAECIFDSSPKHARWVPAHRSVATHEKCGFAPTYFHEITARHGLSCAAAKGVIRELRGSHDLAPMACSQARRVDGWSLRSVVRDPSLGVTRYSRQAHWFDFQRHQFPDNIWCPWPPRR